MKVQQIQQVKYNQNNERLKETNPQFKGVVDTVLRFLATNQGVGANLTDICFMVAPRTISDSLLFSTCFTNFILGVNTL